MTKLQVRDKRIANRFFIDNAFLRGGWGKEVGPYGIAVYNAIAIHADAKEQSAWPSVQLLAELTGMSRPTVIKAVKKLESLHVIAVERRPNKSNKCYLLDKSQWLEVNQVDTKQDELEVNEVNPQKPAVKQVNLTAVNEVDPNKTHVKQDTIKENNTQSSQPTAGVETPTTPQTMFSALAELCKIDLSVLTDKQRGPLNQTEKRLRTKGGATVQDVSAFGEWWYTCDWRGKKGQPPLPHLIRENWKRYTDHRDKCAKQEAERLDALEHQHEQAQTRASEREQNPQLTAALLMWREATEFMRAAMERQMYADWIAPLKVMEPVNGAFRLEAPNETVHEWVTARLMPSIERALNVAGGPAQIEVVKEE